MKRDGELVRHAATEDSVIQLAPSACPGHGMPLRVTDHLYVCPICGKYSPARQVVEKEPAKAA